MTCWHFNDKLIAGGRIGRIKGEEDREGVLYTGYPFLFVFRPSRFFSLFVPLRSQVPGYILPTLPSFFGDTFLPTVGSSKTECVNQFLAGGYLEDF